MTNASGTKDKASAGDPIPPKCSLIEVHVGELKQLFNAIDPSPFRDKDLDPKAEDFIVGWAKELPSDATLGLVLILTAKPVCPMRLPCCATRFTNSSVNAPKLIGGVCANCSV